VSDATLQKTATAIQKSVARFGKSKFKTETDKGDKYVSETLGNLTFSTDLGSTKETDLVIEAIVEDIKVKHELFKTLDKVAPAHTIFTSNTSSLLIGDISAVTNIPCPRLGVEWIGWISWLPRAPLGPIFMTGLYFV